jgi:hypothetical protein
VVAGCSRRQFQPWDASPKPASHFHTDRAEAGDPDPELGRSEHRWCPGSHEMYKTPTTSAKTARSANTETGAAVFEIRSAIDSRCADPVPFPTIILQYQ